MLKRIITTIAAILASTNIAVAGPPLTLGSATFSIPAGWREIERNEERRAFRSPDDSQQATVSLMRFGVASSLEDFRILCSLRLQAEQRAAPDAFIEPDTPEPFKTASGYGLFFSGGEKKTGRIFSCYLSLSGNELITIYLEATGVAPKDHLALFSDIVGSLKRK